jgi:soluble lytic murein transglycosylase-like protein
MRHFQRLRTLLGLCCIGLGAASARAEIVILEDGRFLKAAAYEVNGDRVRIELAIGGSMEMALVRVDRIVEDEIVEATEAEAFSAPPLFLGFSEVQEPPDTPFSEYIFAASRRRNVNPALVAAIVRTESAFDPQAVSKKGARGLMQLMPATALRFGAHPEELFDAEINLETGVTYLGDLITRYSDDLPLILAAYNAGEGAVERHRGVPPYRETQEYIRKIYSLLGVELDAEESPGK